LFWFHPLVWWIGSRLVDERERACDEEVVRTFGEPQTYAEGIVNVCKRYVESPLVCVSGVSGANVKNRIRDIMTNRAVATLTFAKKVALAAVGAVVVVAPMLAQSVLPSEAQLRFDVASVKRATEASGKVRVGDQIWSSAGASFKPGGVFEAVNATLESINPARLRASGVSNGRSTEIGSTPIGSTSRLGPLKARRTVKVPGDSNPSSQSGSH
jgi:hypothetical protein